MHGQRNSADEECTIDNVRGNFYPALLQKGGVAEHPYATQEKKGVAKHYTTDMNIFDGNDAQTSLSALLMKTRALTAITAPPPNQYLKEGRPTYRDYSRKAQKRMTFASLEVAEAGSARLLRCSC